MGIEIRDSRRTDASDVADLITAAFADDGRVAGLVAALRARPDAQADLVAAEDGRIVGHTHLSVSWLDAPARLVEVLTLSPLAVAPARQSQGVGGRLLQAARDAAAQLGAPLVFLEGDPGYYARHGWRPAAALGFTPPSTRIPPPAFQVTTLPGFDPAVMTGALVYNDTFWAHDCVGLRDHDRR